MSKPQVVLGIGACGDPERPELTHEQWALAPAEQTPEQVQLILTAPESQPVAAPTPAPATTFTPMKKDARR